MVYMANELAVKVKVNLDATQDALKTQFGNVQKYADNNPVKVALKVDKKSLESSLREAFGKDAANSIKKNLKNAVDIGDVGKNAFKSATKSLDSLLSKEDELKGKVRELNNLLSQEKYITEQIGKVSGNENKLNELDVWQKRLDEIQSQQKAVFDSVDKVDVGAFDELLVNDRKYLQLTKEITEAKELQTARLKDAAAASAKMDITKSAKDDVASERAAVDQVITALEKRNSLQIQYYNEIKAGRTGNADEIDQSVKRANQELRNAIDSARAFGVNLTDDKRYMEALASGAEKVTIAQNNANKALNNSAIKEQNSDIQSVIESINAYADATKKLYDAQRTGNDKDVYGLAEDQVQKRLAMVQSMADYETKYGEKASANIEIANALNDANNKNTQSYNKLATSVEEYGLKQAAATSRMDVYAQRVKTDIADISAKYGTFAGDLSGVTQKRLELEKLISKSKANNTEVEMIGTISQKYQELRAEIDAVSKSAQQAQNKVKNKTGFDNLSAELDKYINQNPNLSSNADLWKQIQNLNSAVKNYTGTLEDNRAEMASVKAQAEALGLTTETLGQKLTRLWKEHFQTAAVMAGIHLVQQGLQQVYQNVSEVDAAMTELKKVTDETDATYTNFLSGAGQSAKELGASISDIVNSTADFARLGYSLSDATELAKVATVYTHVGDDLSGIDEATESIISTMKAFNIEARDSISIVDKFNGVSNNFAISAGGLGQALQRSASALHTAGNTLSESIGMIVAANDVTQDEESVGNALKVLSLRIRGAKTELKEMGEDAEDVTTSTAKLRDSIKGLTGVDIMKSATEFKSTFDIMDELADKWSRLDDISKASTLEQLAGKNRANVVAGMLENWKDARDAAEEAENSAGAAMAEQEKWSQSIAGRLAELQASFQKLSGDLLDSDIVKVFINIGTAVTDVTDKVVNLTGVLPLLAGAFSTAFAVGGPKLTGSIVIVPTNTLMATWNEQVA